MHVTPIVGLPQFSGWSHVIEGTHSSPHRFVAVLSVAGKHASNVGRDVASLLLSETINSAEELYSKLVAALTATEEVGCQLAIGAALISDKKTVFAVSRAAVFLRRQTKIGTILQSGTTLKLIEGSRAEDDVFALVTEQATQFLGEIELKSKQGYDVDTIITSIVPGVHAQPDSSLSAFAFVTHDEEDWESNTQFVHSPKEDPEAKNELVAAEEVLTDVAGSELLESASHQPSSDQTLAHKRTKVWDFLQVIRHGLLSIGKIIGAILQWLWLLLLWLLRSFVRLVQTTRGIAPATDDMSAVAYQSPVRQRRARLLLMIIVVSIVLLVIGIGYVLYRKNTELAEANRLVEPLRKQLIEAQSKVETQPVEAREQTLRVIQELNALEASHSEKQRMVAAFAAEKTVAQQVFDSISGQEALTTLPVFYDLRLMKSDFVTTHTTRVGSFAVFLDAEKRQLVSLNLSDKTAKLLSLDNQTSLRAITGSSDGKVFMLNGGITAMALETDAQTETIKAEGDSTRGGTLLGTFDRFLYVFNPAKRNLYRYAQQDSGFSDPIAWLQVSRGLDYSTVVSMTIDGDIWLGGTDGSIKKFTSGAEQEFSISGLPQALDSAVTLFTTQESDSLYVLEPARHRVVVLTKLGVFLREFSNQSLGAATGLLVDESQNKAFAVSGATVFEIAL